MLYIYFILVFLKQNVISYSSKTKTKKRRKINSLNTYVPYTISSLKDLNLGMGSLLKASRERSTSRPFWENLSQEILLASLGKGEVVAKRYSLNKLVDSNKRRVHLGYRRLFPIIPESKI